MMAKHMLPTVMDGPRAIRLSIDLKQFISATRLIDLAFSRDSAVLHVTFIAQNTEDGSGYDIEVSNVVTEREHILPKLLRLSGLGPLSCLRPDPKRCSD